MDSSCSKTDACVLFHLAKTRKEEITRFDKARSDVEFGKMLKSRFLSPEQTELQTQLRRNVRVGPRTKCLRADTDEYPLVHPRSGHQNGGPLTIF